MLETPPPLPDESDEPEKFALPVWAWICWGVYFAFRVLLFVVRKEPFSAYGFGELIGGALAMLAIPTILAWMLWRIAGRSRAALAATFFIVFVLAVLGQIGQFAKRVQARQAFDHLKDEQQKLLVDQRAALAQGKQLDTGKAQQLAAQAGEQFDKVAHNSSGSERQVAEAMKVYMDEIAGAMRRYEASLLDLHADTFWNLNNFAPGAPAEKHRKSIRAFAKANTDLSAYQDKDGTALRRIVSASGAQPRDVEGVMAGYQKGASSRLQYVIKIRECDAQLAQAMLEFVDTEEAIQGKWHRDSASGKLIFTDNAALARYNDVLKRVRDISARQAEFQRLALAAK